MTLFRHLGCQQQRRAEPDKKCRKKCPGRKAELNNAAFQDRLLRKVDFKILALIDKENNF